MHLPGYPQPLLGNSLLRAVLGDLVGVLPAQPSAAAERPTYTDSE
jgi:hypothetical protein